MPKGPKGKKGKLIEDSDLTLGRFGKTLKMGLVGLPNVGKSTTFNVLTDLDVPAENFPFCTKEPHEARVAVPDVRFDKLVEIYKPKSRIPAHLNIWDIAGLIRGAHKGEGLGNAFLSNIASVDGIFHVVRAFKNPEIVHTEMEVNPVADMEVISYELIMKDLASVETSLADLYKKINRQKTKVDENEAECLERVKAILEKNLWIKDTKWDYASIQILNKHLFMTAKPVIYLVNIGDTDYTKQKNKWLPKIKEWIKAKCPGKMIPYSASFEAQHAKGEMEGKSMIKKIISAGYDNLNLQHFFTTGKDEVRCWTIKKGTKAPQAAGKIHGDMEAGFICADVVSYDHFIASGASESKCKSEGQLRQQGKDYVFQDGDITHFKFNPPKGGKKKK